MEDIVFGVKWPLMSPKSHSQQAKMLRGYISTRAKGRLADDAQDEREAC